MPVTFTPYDNNNSIWVYHCEGDWTWAEFGQIDHRAIMQFGQVDNRLDIIIDMTDSNTIPLGIMDIVHQVGERSPRLQQELRVFVQAPLSIQIIIRTIKYIYPNKSRTYLFVKSLDEAIAIIEQDRTDKM